MQGKSYKKIQSLSIILQRSQLANWSQQKGIFFYCILNRKSYEENHLKST